MVADAHVAVNRRGRVSVAPGHRPQHQDHEHGTERGDDERAEPAGSLVLAQHVDPQPSTDEAADDADGHRAETAVALTAGHERAGDRPGQQADDDPPEEAEFRHGSSSLTKARIARPVPWRTPMNRRKTAQ